MKACNSSEWAKYLSDDISAADAFYHCPELPMDRGGGCCCWIDYRLRGLHCFIRSPPAQVLQEDVHMCIKFPTYLRCTVDTSEAN